VARGARTAVVPDRARLRGRTAGVRRCAGPGQTRHRAVPAQDDRGVVALVALAMGVRASPPCAFRYRACRRC
jgi:hypothetical protein